MKNSIERIKESRHCHITVESEDKNLSSCSDYAVGQKISAVIWENNTSVSDILELKNIYASIKTKIKVKKSYTQIKINRQGTKLAIMDDHYNIDLYNIGEGLFVDIQGSIDTGKKELVKLEFNKQGTKLAAIDKEGEIYLHPVTTEEDHIAKSEKTLKDYFYINMICKPKQLTKNNPPAKCLWPNLPKDVQNKIATYLTFADRETDEEFIQRILKNQRCHITVQSADKNLSSCSDYAVGQKISAVIWENNTSVSDILELKNIYASIKTKIKVKKSYTQIKINRQGTKLAIMDDHYNIDLYNIGEGLFV